MPITRLNITGLLPTGPLPDCTLLLCYQHAHYQNVYYCSATNMQEVRNGIQKAIGVHYDLLTMIKKRKLRWYGHISRSSGMAKTILQGTMKGEKREEDRRRDRKITSRNGREWGLEISWGQPKTENDGKVLLQRHLWCPDDLEGYGTEMRWELPLFCYQQAHNQIVYYCSSTHMPITRLNTTVVLPTGPLPDCILLFYYPQPHYQTVYYCSATYRPTSRLHTTVQLTTDQLLDCIRLFCYPHGHY